MKRTNPLLLLLVICFLSAEGPSVSPLVGPVPLSVEVRGASDCVCGNGAAPKPKGTHLICVYREPGLYRLKAGGSVFLIRALGEGAVPWGPMYPPGSVLPSVPFTGAVLYYRGESGARRLLSDLPLLRSWGVKVILTLGTPNVLAYFPAGELDREALHRELDPFFNISDVIDHYCAIGTVWGIRFADEPHDPSSGNPIPYDQFDLALSIVKSHFPHAKLGSTSPPSYLKHVPSADWSSLQFNHSSPSFQSQDPVQVLQAAAQESHRAGLLFVAAINSSANSIDDQTFFNDLARVCRDVDADFVTSWQWNSSRSRRKGGKGFGERLAKSPQPAEEVFNACSHGKKREEKR